MANNSTGQCGWVSLPQVYMLTVQSRKAGLLSQVSSLVKWMFVSAEFMCSVPALLISGWKCVRIKRKKKSFRSTWQSTIPSSSLLCTFLHKWQATSALAPITGAGHESYASESSHINVIFCYISKSVCSRKSKHCSTKNFHTLHVKQTQSWNWILL